MMSDLDRALNTRLADALRSCPTCMAGRMNTALPEDGIPDGYVFEASFQCGSAVFVSADGQYSVGRGCPGPLETALEDLREQIAEKFEDDRDGGEL